MNKIEEFSKMHNTLNNMIRKNKKIGLYEGEEKEACEIAIKMAKLELNLIDGLFNDLILNDLIIDYTEDLAADIYGMIKWDVRSLEYDYMDVINNYELVDKDELMNKLVEYQLLLCNNLTTYMKMFKDRKSVV